MSALGTRIAAVLRTPEACVGALDEVLDRLHTRRFGDAPIALFLLSPALAILSVFGLFPLGYAVYMSLFGARWGMGPFVGLANYGEVLRSGAFWNSFLVTTYYSVGTIPATMVFSFIIARLLFGIVRGRGLLRTMYFLPYVTSAVAAAMVWRGILNPKFGLANPLLEWFGFEAQNWLLEPRSVLNLLTNGAVPAHVGPSLALCCVMMFEVWHGSGFMIVIFLAGLSTIPRELEEAARIDGANALQVVRNVTLPLLSPTIFFLAIVSVIKSFQAFNSFFALTGDGHGPLDTTQNMTVYIYSEFYEFHRWGYGTAVATMLCLAIVMLTWVQWRYVGRRVHYE
ncbi:MAG TPA: sugar ABC transporter permease [Candidatus Hydrogenedentes bacterium]|nr:sugar ABC transporter permease [Candidatus Hydrogenedentota bacterium]